MPRIDEMDSKSDEGRLFLQGQKQLFREMLHCEVELTFSQSNNTFVAQLQETDGPSRGMSLAARYQMRDMACSVFAPTATLEAAMGKKRRDGIE